MEFKDCFSISIKIKEVYFVLVKPDVLECFSFPARSSIDCVVIQ